MNAAYDDEGVQLSNPEGYNTTTSTLVGIAPSASSTINFDTTTFVEWLEINEQLEAA